MGGWLKSGIAVASCGMSVGSMKKMMMGMGLGAEKRSFGCSGLNLNRMEPDRSYLRQYEFEVSGWRTNLRPGHAPRNNLRQSRGVFFWIS